MNHLFFLGQNHKLATLELQAVFPELEFTSFAEGILASDFESLDFCRLGGILKIAKQVAQAEVDDIPNVLPQLMSDSKRFSLTFLGEKAGTHDISQKTKEKLLETKSGARFVLSQDASGLSAVILQKQKVAEFFFDPTTNILYQTIWSHPFRQWVARDRHRPYVAPKLGMLPPKLARMMVNLGLKGKNPSQTTVLDPFCGTGTVLMEALLMGCSVVGSDLSKTQVDGAKKNLAWLPEEYFCAQRRESEVMICDATHLASVIKQKVDVIVTEPFLGKPNPKPTEIQNILRGLHKLYIGSFKEWHKFLPSNARVIFVYPLFAKDPYTQKQARKFIDTCENLGYNCLESDLDFTRPGAEVYRKILIFEKK